MHHKAYILTLLVCLLNLAGNISAPAQDSPHISTVALYDGGTLWGGQELYILTNGLCYTRVIRSVKGIQEQRYETQLSTSDLKALEQLLEKHHFSTLKIKDRAGVPDEARTTIRVKLSTGEVQKQSKWRQDSVPDFDPIYKHLLNLVKQAQRSKPIYKGTPYPWRPEGFE